MGGLGGGGFIGDGILGACIMGQQQQAEYLNAAANPIAMQQLMYERLRPEQPAAPVPTANPVLLLLDKPA